MAIATFYPDADTYLSQATGEFGGSTVLVCGPVVVFSSPILNRILLRFNLSPLQESRVDSASLVLTLASAAFPDEPHVLTAFELTGEWDEATANWLQRSTGVAWDTPGGDYREIEVAEATVANGATSVSMDATDLVVRNRGGSASVLLILPESESHIGHRLTCHSREVSVVANRPQLVVSHVTPTGSPLQWSVLGPSQAHWS